MQHALLSLFELVRQGVLSVETVVEKTAHAPATRFSVKERGFIREGYHADLVLIDDHADGAPEKVLSKCGWSPFEGIDLQARVRATWVNGHLRYRDGGILGGPKGVALEFDR